MRLDICADGIDTLEVLFEAALRPLLFLTHKKIFRLGDFERQKLSPARKYK